MLAILFRTDYIWMNTALISSCKASIFHQNHISSSNICVLLSSHQAKQHLRFWGCHKSSGRRHHKLIAREYKKRIYKWDRKCKLVRKNNHKRMHKNDFPSIYTKILWGYFRDMITIGKWITYIRLTDWPIIQFAPAAWTNVRKKKSRILSISSVYA
jgi:hypothetical protein